MRNISSYANLHDFATHGIDVGGSTIHDMSMKTTPRTKKLLTADQMAAKLEACRIRRDAIAAARVALALASGRSPFDRAVRAQAARLVRDAA